MVHRNKKERSSRQERIKFRGREVIEYVKNKEEETEVKRERITDTMKNMEEKQEKSVHKERVDFGEKN